MLSRRITVAAAALAAAFSATLAAQQGGRKAVAELLKPFVALGEQAKAVLEPRSIHVPAGGSLQSAIDTAEPGGAITLEPGATYGAAVIRKPLTLTTRGADLGNRRATDADALVLGTIATIDIAPGARDVTLARVAVRCAPTTNDCVLVGHADDSQTRIEQAPARIVLDQIVVLGADGTKRGVALHGADVTLERSWVAGIRRKGQETSAVGGWNGPGPFVIENNYLEAASIGVLIGGATPTIAGLVPENIRIARNTITKDLSWRGARYAVKNAVEIKAARNVEIVENALERVWPDGQDGFAILLKPANPGRLPQAVTADVLVARNIVRDVSSGINLLGHDYTDLAGQLARVIIRDNRFDISKAAWGGAGQFLKIGGEPKDVIVEHNAVIHDGTSLVNTYLGSKMLADGTKVAGGPVRGFRFIANAATAHGYGFFLAGAAHAKDWNKYFPDGVIEKNALADVASAGKANLPGNTFVTRTELLAGLDAAGKGLGALVGFGVR